MTDTRHGQRAEELNLLMVSLLAGDGLELRPSGLIGSFIVAVVVVIIWRAIDARS